MVRDKHVRFSESDKDSLKAARDTVFDSSMPLGLVAAMLADEAVEAEKKSDKNDVRL